MIPQPAASQLLEFDPEEVHVIPKSELSGRDICFGNKRFYRAWVLLRHGTTWTPVFIWGDDGVFSITIDHDFLVVAPNAEIAELKWRIDFIAKKHIPVSRRLCSTCESDLKVTARKSLQDEIIELRRLERQLELLTT